MKRAERDRAFTEFVAARQTHLRRVAYALTGDWHRAEDLLQTSLTKAYLAWPRIADRGAEEAYVRRIMVRANVDESRRPWRREHPGLEGLDGMGGLDTGAASGETDLAERSALFDALQQLPEMQRKVVVLRHWLGLSVREAATELGISEGTVKSHSHRGLAALESVLTRA